MGVCDIFQMLLFSYTEILNVYKPTFFGTTLTNQNYMHEKIKSRLNTGMNMCVCVCQNEPLLRAICSHCILTILMSVI
jgi:hypothetical protein